MIVDISKITLNNIRDYQLQPYKKDYGVKKHRLLYLLKDKEHVTTKDIIENIYNNKNIKRQTAAQLIRNLRDDGYKIETISKVGYRLLDK